MATWEYGYLYVLNTNNRGHKGPTVYVALEAGGPWLIGSAATTSRGSSAFLGALDAVGARGWFVDRVNAMAVRRPGEDVEEIALQMDGADGLYDNETVRYFMHRDSTG
jgi:hypothetical protein